MSYLAVVDPVVADVPLGSVWEIHIYVFSICGRLELLTNGQTDQTGTFCEVNLQSSA